MNWFSKIEQAFVQFPRELADNPQDFQITPTELAAIIKIASHKIDWIIPSKILSGSLRTSQRIRESLKKKGWINYEVIRKKDEKGNFYTIGIKYDLSPIQHEIYIRRGIETGKSRVITEINERKLSDEPSAEKKTILLNSKIRTFIDGLSDKICEQIAFINRDFFQVKYYYPSRYEIIKWEKNYDIDLLNNFDNYLSFVINKIIKEKISLPTDIKGIIKNKEAIDFFIGNKPEPPKEEVFKDDKEVDEFIKEFMEPIEEEEKKDYNLSEDNELKNTTDYKKFGIKDSQWENMVRIFPEEYRRRVSAKTINDMIRILDNKEIDYDDVPNVINALYYPYKEGYLVPEWDELPTEKTLNIKPIFEDGLKKGMIYSSWSCNNKLEDYFINYKERNAFEELLNRCDGKAPNKKEDKILFVDFLKKIKMLYETCDRTKFMGCFWENEEPNNEFLEKFRNRMKEEREKWYQAFMAKKGFFEDTKKKMEELDNFIYLNFGFITALGRSLYYPRKYYFNILDNMKKDLYKEHYSEIESKFKNERDCELKVIKMPFDDICYSEEKRRFEDKILELKKQNGCELVWENKKIDENFPNSVSDFVYNM